MLNLKAVLNIREDSRMRYLTMTARAVFASILLMAILLAVFVKFSNFGSSSEPDQYLALQPAITLLLVIGAGAVIIILYRKIIHIRSENLENEKRWQFALEGCGDGVWDWNVETGELFYSSRYKEILGFSENEMDNNLKEWAERLHPDDSETAMREIGKIHKGETQGCSFEHRMRCKSGDYRWMLTRGKIIRQTGEGTPTRITGTLTDITERKLMSEHFLKAQRLQSVSAFASGIANEYNNILTAVIGYTSLGRILRNSPEKARKALESAEEAAYRAAELTRQILFFAKDGVQFKMVVNVANLLHESASLALRNSNITFSCRACESLYVDVDREQMELALSNIILNSAQAMREEGEVTLKGEACTLRDTNWYKLPSGNYLKLTLTDQGPGIPPENIEKIFDPYFSTKSGCMGLGLTTAHAIVSEHGGTIDVHSAISSGTTFTVYLPLSEKKCDLPEKADMESSFETNHKGNILVMDDEELIRNLSSELLRLLGYQVSTCCDGDEAIETYRTAMELNRPFSAAIMDLSIPGGMGGKDAAQGILALDAKARLIVSSGYCDDPVMADFEKYGFIAAVSKPYTVDKIIKTLESIDNLEGTDTS